MKLWYDKRLKDPAYYAQIGYRLGNKTTTRNVKNFGKHSELLKITDDPLAYVREEIRKMNEEYREGKATFTLTSDYNERVKSTGECASASTWLNIGYFFLQDIMKGLCLKEFFREKTKGRKITFDCYTICRFLTYARILDPASKLAFSRRLDIYYEKPKFAYQHVLRYMDILAENYNDYLEWLFRKSNSIVKRDTSVLYYDCTNFYFESERADEDYVDETTGELISGLRQFGVSKQHQPRPLVEMGLFMDGQGIPITMSLHSGSENEQKTAIPLEKEVLKMLDGAKFIYCADAGLGSYGIRQFNSMGGRAFIVTQSLKKLSQVLQDAVFNDNDYRLLSSDQKITIKYMKEFDRHDARNLNLYNDKAYKVIIADKAVDLGLYEEKVLKNGKVKKVKAKGQLRQRVIITFSRKMLEYQRAVRNSQVERAKKLLAAGDIESLRKNQNDAKRFLKRVPSSGGGKKEKAEYMLDMDKVLEEEKYDGYYAVATNLDDPARDILAVSGKRYMIEDCFRIMKTDLLGRPVNHRTPPRIEAHFLICYTGLLVCRLLETKLDGNGTHVTTENLITTLKNLNVANIHDIEYTALYNGSLALDALTRLNDLNLDRVHYRPKDLNGKIKKMLK